MSTNVTNKAIVTKQSLTTLVLGFTALTLAGAAVAKHKLVTRPFFAKSHVGVVIDLSTGEWNAMNEGNATHLGHFTGEAAGMSGASIVGEGIITAANGDQAFTIPPRITNCDFLWANLPFEAWPRDRAYASRQIDRNSLVIDHLHRRSIG